MQNVTWLMFIWIELMGFINHVEASFKTLCDEMEIGIPELHALRSLYAKDGVLVSALAISIGKAATSFTPVLDKLAGKGFVERRQNPDDRRSVLVFLTPRGEKWREQVVALFDQVETQMRGEMPNWLHMGTDADEAALADERDAAQYEDFGSVFDDIQELDYSPAAEEPVQEIPF